MATFNLHDSSIKATVGASAKITSSNNTQATITVTATGSIPYGYYVYSTGVVATITINGSSSTKTVFGNGSLYYRNPKDGAGTLGNFPGRDDGTKSVTYSITVDKSTAAKSISWSVAFKNAIDGTVIATKHTATGTVSVPAKTSYTISYNANGGSGAPSSQTKWYGSALTLSSTKPTRTGYSFQGWATSASATSAAYASGGSYTANANATLYAVWKANTYTVTYNKNTTDTVSNLPSNQTKTYGKALTLSSTKPTRANYTFLGWATSASGSVTYAPGASYTDNANVTLYAKWQLAYVKPRIKNLKVFRCDEDCNFSDDGESVLVYYEWQTDIASPTIVISWSPATEGVSSYTTSANTGLTSGSGGWLLGDWVFSSETTYTFKVTVTDSNGSSSDVVTMPGTKFAIDFKAGGNGVAVGKPAELEGVFDVALQTQFLGGIKYVVLEPGTNLDNVLTPGFYMGADITTNNYGSCPTVTGTFTLLVEACGEVGQVRQTYISCSKNKPERYSRHYYQSEWGGWHWANTDEHVLYENESGTISTVDFPTSVTQYRYLEIYFIDNNGKSGGYTKVWKPKAGMVISLSMTEAGSSIWSRQTTYTIGDKYIMPTVSNASYVKITSDGSVSVVTGTNYIKIVRVVGRA